MSGGLVAFLRARLDEDWEVAQRENTYPSGKPISAEAWERVAGEADSMLVSMFSPARVLAEVEAKRRIIELHRRYEGAIRQESANARPGDPTPATLYASRDTLAAVLRFLALPYAGHEDYRPEWSPW